MAKKSKTTRLSLKKSCRNRNCLEYGILKSTRNFYKEKTGRYGFKENCKKCDKNADKRFDILYTYSVPPKVESLRISVAGGGGAGGAGVPISDVTNPDGSRCTVYRTNICSNERVDMPKVKKLNTKALKEVAMIWGALVFIVAYLATFISLSIQYNGYWIPGIAFGVPVFLSISYLIYITSPSHRHRY